MSSDRAPVRTTPAAACGWCGADGIVRHEGLTDRLLAAPGVWNLRECAACQVAWLDPQPWPDDVAALYQGAYMTHAATPLADAARNPADRYLDAVYGRPAVPPAASWLRAVPGLDHLLGGAGAWLPAPPGGRVLDVGCGSGAFLARMRRRGWDVCGVEPDPAAAAAARAVHGIDVAPTVAALGDRRFDAIVMHHVVEHLPDPPAVIRELAERLAPGGRLVIVTPNLHSLGRRRFGSAWVHWDPPRHLWLFSRPALVATVERSGLVVERHFTTARHARFVGTQAGPIARTGRAAAGRPTWPGRVRGLLFQAGEHVQHLADADAGEELVVVAARPAADVSAA